MPRQTALLCIAFLCGCDAATSSVTIHELNLPRGNIAFSQGSRDGQPGIDFGSIRYEGKRAIVWSDGHEDGYPEYSDTSVKGQIHSFRPGAMKCNYEIAVNGKGGAATIDGKKYEIADGNLFLVSLGESSIRVLQLKRDLPEVDLTHNGDNGSALKMAMKSDSEFNGFFCDVIPESSDIK